jgi:4-alpha-glucanotransferase
MPEFLGTLLPLTALNKKSPTNLFEEGIKFVDWLADTSQNAWQFLPLHPTAWDEDDLYASPYTSFGIGLNPLFAPGIKPIKDPDFEAKHSDWLPDFALYLALSEHFNTGDWTAWPTRIRKHMDLDKWRTKLADRVAFHTDVQSSLHQEFYRLRSSAKSKNIQLIGDVPFYLPLETPFVWAYQDCFLINPDGSLPFVSGAEGEGHFIRQVWGHPLYRWTELSRLLKLWTIRTNYMASMYDGVRLDAAAAFYIYGQMSTTDEAHDRIAQGAGDKIFVPLINHCLKEGLKVFAEDVSGYDLSELQQAMTKLGLPGVSVFTLSLTGTSEILDTKHFDPDVAHTREINYSSTHDTPTLAGFLEELTPGQKRVLRSALKVPITAKSIRQLLLNRCHKLIVPMQDWQLTKKRINVPGTINSHNWSYRIDLNKLKAP